MSVTKKDVEHIANLARLEFSEEEKEQFTEDLETILHFAERINDLDTEDVLPTSHPMQLANVVREDRVRPSLPVEEALQNTPDHRHNQVKVPSIIEEE